MATAKIAVTIDEELLARLDQLVGEKKVPSRSRAVQDAIAEKVEKLERRRLAAECAKLDKREEQRMADEGLAEDFKEWPAY